jgi:hypothetical protein
VAVLFTNNATTTLASPITSSATSITVAAATGARFPTPSGGDVFYATLIDASNNIEIVQCTARATDVLTVVRAQESTTARAYTTGDRLELRPTAAGLNSKFDKAGGTITGATTVSGALTLGSTLTLGGTVSLPAGTTTFSSGTANFTTGLELNGSSVVSLTGTQTLTNKTLTAPTITNGGTLTLPSGAHTLVARTTTDTLTNKTLSTSCVFTADCSLNDSGTIAATSPGFRGLPQNSQSADYTLALTDAGKCVALGTGAFTIPANASVAFPVGTTIVLYNSDNSQRTVNITSDTLRLSGTTSTGTRVISSYGVATLVKVASTTWVISGPVV